MFVPGQRVAVAVSGGADSVCLLHLLRELAPRLNLSLTVIHLNHRLRGADSDADEEFVRTLAESLALPFLVKTVDVRALDDNLEQAGRKARGVFYSELIESRRVERIATGHTRSDQAETVLFRFLRGSGNTGLAGILPITAEGLVRPLIEIERSEVRSWLGERGIGWREDSSNELTAFVRNRIRRELLPQLERDYNPALTSTLSHSGEIARAEEEYWEAEMNHLSAVHFVSKPPAILLRASDVSQLPKAVGRRLIRRALQQVKGDLRTIGFPHIEHVLTMAADPLGHARVQLPGLDIFRSFEWLRIGPPKQGSRADRDYEFSVQVPGSVSIPATAERLRLDLIEIPGSSGASAPEWGYNELGSQLDEERVSNPLILRNWRPGDQYAPVGHSEVKIKTLFQQQRIPIWDRQGWPVIKSGDQIVWARQFGVAACFAPTPKTRRIIRILEVKNITDA
jgi:tRNA(Ile)-lysidine synthase